MATDTSSNTIEQQHGDTLGHRNFPARVLVISRNGTWWRRWLNEQESMASIESNFNCSVEYLPDWFYSGSLRQQSSYISQFRFIIAVYGAGVTSMLLAAPGTTILSLQPSDTVLDYSFYPVLTMMARHIGVQYLPWAANSDPRFVSIPERLASAPRNQQLRDSDFSLPFVLVRGLFLQGVQMSRCWSAALQGSTNTFDDLKGTSGAVSSSRFKDLCDEDASLYDGFEANGWPTFELRYSRQKMHTWLNDAGWI